MPFVPDSAVRQSPQAGRIDAREGFAPPEEPNFWQRTAKAIAGPMRAVTGGMLSLGAGPQWEMGPDGVPKLKPGQLPLDPPMQSPFAKQASEFMIQDTPTGLLATAGGVGGQAIKLPFRLMKTMGLPFAVAGGLTGGAAEGNPGHGAVQGGFSYLGGKGLEKL